MVAINKSNPASIDVLDIDPNLVMAEAIKSFTTPKQIEALEGELLGFNNIPIVISHSFCKGIYARTATMPAGSIAIGHAHSEECLNIVVAGSVSVVIDGEVKKVSAPATFVSPPFARKVGYIHKDLTWVTIHPVSHSEISKLEAELIIKSETFKRYEQSTDLAVCYVDRFTEDRLDYLKYLDEIGLDEKEARNQVESMDDQVPVQSDLVSIKSSPIQGNGIFSNFDIGSNKTIGTARIDGKRTAIGRYTNHSKNPNAKMKSNSVGSIFLVSIRSIEKGEEVVVDYRQARSEALLAKSIMDRLTI